MLKVGIVGLPNVGKSTVFNALSNAVAKVSNYPFCTVEPNLGVVAVPDERLERLAQIFHQQKVVPATIEFVDIAGLVRGASKGEGLGNQFLHHIREVDAILHVVRCFPSPQISHVEGEVDPVRDIELVNLELGLADLARVEKRLEEIQPKARSGDTHAVKAIHALEKIRETLGKGLPTREVPLQKLDWEELPDLNLLTSKPVLYLANVGDGEKDSQTPDSPQQKLEEYLTARGEMLVAMPAKLEADLAELSEEERAEFAQDMEVTTAANEVIRACYRLLGLITFFTGVGAEVRSWAIPEGTTVRDAAGKIHTDMARGFIRAEVISLADLEKAGSWEAARRDGHIRLEGKEYIVKEGDVCYFRFSV